MLRDLYARGPGKWYPQAEVVGLAGEIWFQDFYHSIPGVGYRHPEWSEDHPDLYCGMIAVYDDDHFTPEEVLAQVQTLLSLAGADGSQFYIYEIGVHFPDALPIEWYRRVGELAWVFEMYEDLETRDENQEKLLQALRKEIAFRVACATEQAEHNIEEFTTAIEGLFYGPRNSQEIQPRPNPAADRAGDVRMVDRDSHSPGPGAM